MFKCIISPVLALTPSLKGKLGLFCADQKENKAKLVSSRVLFIGEVLAGLKKISFNSDLRPLPWAYTIPWSEVG